MDLQGIFDVADAAKDQGEYTIANMAFAALVTHFSPDLLVELETRDAEGRSLEEGYYDLFVLRNREGEYGGYLCIPAPLLQSWATLQLMKQAEIVERQEHNRQIAPEAMHASPESLWERLVKATGLTREGLNASYCNIIEPED